MTEPQGTWLRQPGDGTAIVFVHGLLSDGDGCWRSESAYWPDLVAQERSLATTGIYVFSYRTAVFSGSYSIGDAVEALNAYLELDGLLNLRGLVFVCHSMGGIVTRQFLVTRQASLVAHSTRIGLFLAASPSLGAEYANLFSHLASALGHAQLVALRFSQDNSWLNDLDRNFMNLKESKHLAISGQELIEDRFVVLQGLFSKQVVEPFSGSRYFGDSIKIPGSDHFTIAKPSSRDSLQHRLLVRFVQEFHEANGALAAQQVVAAGRDKADRARDGASRHQTEREDSGVGASQDLTRATGRSRLDRSIDTRPDGTRRVEQVPEASLGSAATGGSKVPGKRVLSGATKSGSDGPPPKSVRVRGGGVLATCAVMLGAWILVSPQVLDTEFPLLTAASAAMAFLAAAVFSQPRTLGRFHLVPVGRALRRLLIAVAAGMLVLWALGYRLMNTGEGIVGLQFSATLHAQQPTTSKIDVVEGTSVELSGLNLAVCVGRIGPLGDREFVLLATAELQAPEAALVSQCQSVSTVLDGVRPVHVLSRGTLPRSGVARQAFKYGDASFQVTLEPKLYFLSPNVVRVSISRSLLPSPAPLCKYIVFDRIAAEDDNSKNRKAFVLRLTDGTPQNDYRAELSDSRLPYQSLVIAKDLPAKSFGATISFTYRGTTPRATLNSPIDLASGTERFRAAIDFDRGVSFVALSTGEFLDFIGRHSIDAPNCDTAPKGLSWK